NIEYWPYDQPTPRSIVIPPHGQYHVPDLPNFCWSEYGNRCGMPRLLKLFDAYKIPVSASINASVLDVYPTLARAVRDAGWEFRHPSTWPGYRNRRTQAHCGSDREASEVHWQADARLDEPRLVGNI